MVVHGNLVAPQGMAFKVISNDLRFNCFIMKLIFDESETKTGDYPETVLMHFILKYLVI